MTEQQKEKVIEFTKDYYRYSLSDDGYCIERYVDYRDEFPRSTIKKVLSSDNPWETLSEEVFEWDCQCDDWCYEKEFFSKLETFCEENEIDDSEARDIVYETFQWSYPESFLNPEINTVWTINHGDMNYDFTKHNILNYAGNYGYCNGLEKKSGLYWLAKQQKHLTELKKAIDDKSPKSYFNSSDLVFLLRQYMRKHNIHFGQRTKEFEQLSHKLSYLEYFVNRDGEEDPFAHNELVKLCNEYDIMIYENVRSKFTDSCITELENLCCNMGAVTFLVKMDLQDAIRIKQQISDMEHSKGFDEYNNENIKGCPYGYIVLDKSTEVGLVDPSCDSGSVIEIELDKDVKIPLQFLWNITTDDALQNCYGLVDDCWQSSIKEIKLKEIANG